jgi:hypothetical protein
MQKNSQGEKSMKLAISTKQIALTAIFAALYAVLRAIPTVPMIGVPGASFSLSDILAPIYGIILGPYVGGLSVLIGTFTAMSVKPPVFLGLDFLPGFVNAVALGFLVRRKRLPVIALNIFLLLAFVLNPLTLVFVSVPLGSTNLSFPFMWLHIVALIILISPLGLMATKWVEKSRVALAITGFVILAFIGTMIQHLMGNILYENIFVYVTNFMTPEFLTLKWQVVFFLYPWERLILVVLAVLVGLPLIRALRKTGLTPIKNATPTPQNNDSVQ